MVPPSVSTLRILWKLEIQKKERKSWYRPGEKYLCLFGGIGADLKNPWTVANSVRQGLNGRPAAPWSWWG